MYMYMYKWCTHDLARLRSIEDTIQNCTNTLYRACANASPQDMNDAMIGVSQQVNIMSLWNMYMHTVHGRGVFLIVLVIKPENIVRN